ncbi:CMP-N,N'-diacetyllegionaminic acid synthase [Candidatus Magnetomoraceae bacterium gMMP-1]
MKSIGLIPARGGSKGIPNKNIYLLCGKPLIAYTIEAALASKDLDRVIVSTDSKKIAQIAKSYGAEVPFIRSKSISQDDTPDKPVIEHVIRWLKENENYCFDYLAYLRPTTPLKKSSIIDKALKKIRNNTSCTGLRSITKSEGVFHPFWMYKIKNGLLEPFIDNIDKSLYCQRQLLPECYRLNGVIDVIKTSIVISSETNIYGDKIIFYKVEEKYAIDIDNEFDMLLCEYMLQKNQ